MGKMGMELPINTIIIFIIGLIVLTGILYFFAYNSDQQNIALQYQKDWQQACSAMKMRGCQMANYYDITINGREFAELCTHNAGTQNPFECCEACCGRGKCS